jgi:hypothetical protein
VTWLAAAVLAVLVAGCAATPRVVPITAAPGPPRVAADRIADYPEAFQAIAAVMSRELKLPIPPVALYLYPHRDAFQQGLVTERGMQPALAEQTAGYARGLGGADKILVNEGALARVPWPDRIRFLAHEFTHTIQFALADGRRSTSEQWLREGFADWAAYRVVDSLGLERYADRRAQRIREVRAVLDTKPFPSLTEVVTFPQWSRWRSKHGAEVTYGQAFLATDLLIERKGYQAAVDYFRRFARSDNRLANFRAAFAQDLRAFAREFPVHLRALR